MCRADVIDIYEDSKLKKISISGACINWGAPIIASFLKEDTDNMNKTISDFVKMVSKNTKTPPKARPIYSPKPLLYSEADSNSVTRICDEDGSSYSGGTLFSFVREDVDVSHRCIVSIKSEYVTKGTLPQLFDFDMKTGHMKSMAKYTDVGVSLNKPTPSHIFTSWKDFTTWKKNVVGKPAYTGAKDSGINYESILNDNYKTIGAYPDHVFDEYDDLRLNPDGTYKVSISNGTYKPKTKTTKKKSVELFFW